MSLLPELLRNRFLRILLAAAVFSATFAQLDYRDLQVALFTSGNSSDSFSLKDRFSGYDFFSPSWKWETFDDPTHGRVNYLDQQTARAKQLAYGVSWHSRALDAHAHPVFLVSGGKFIMRADSESVVPPTARGRDSIRIISNTAYDDALVILEISHMPYGCGTWPAFWSLSKKGPWPNGGEIDILEGQHQYELQCHTKLKSNDLRREPWITKSHVSTY